MMRLLKFGLAIPLLSEAVSAASSCSKRTRTVTVTADADPTSFSTSVVKYSTLSAFASSSSISSSFSVVEVTTSSSSTPTATSTSSLTPSTASASAVAITSTSVTTPSGSTTTTAGPSSGTGTATLSSGWYWVRAVETPYSHSYLQTQPTGTPGAAVLSSYALAGQLNIIDGQLVYNAGDGATELYMNVEDPTDKTQRKLQTWFSETQNSYGTFSFSGDTINWNVSDISRQNLGAWYVCDDQQLYINTGAYDYETPNGCSDETIHSYGGSVANV